MSEKTVVKALRSIFTYFKEYGNANCPSADGLDCAEGLIKKGEAPVPDLISDGYTKTYKMTKLVRMKAKGEPITDIKVRVEVGVRKYDPNTSSL